jgi:hypothetical protein
MVFGLSRGLCPFLSDPSSWHGRPYQGFQDGLVLILLDMEHGLHLLRREVMLLIMRLGREDRERVMIVVILKVLCEKSVA